MARRIALTSAAISAILLCRMPLRAEDAEETFFETRIRPVLIERCFECHGKASEESHLRVDSREGLLKGGDSGAAIVPGNPDGSLLLKAIRRTSDDLQMPPDKPLDDRIVADFARWINRGARWPKFDPVMIRRRSAVTDARPLAPDAPPLKPALQAWFKADGQPWHDGQPVYLWQDAGGRGHDLAATAGARPEGTGQPARFVAHSQIFGSPAVHFEMNTGLGGNASTAPEIKGDAEFTLFVVARINSVPAGSDGLVAGFGEPAHPVNPGIPRCAIIGLQAAGGRPVFIGGWGNDAALKGDNDDAIVGGPPAIIALTKQRGPLASTAHFYVNGVKLHDLTGSTAVPDFGRRPDLGFFMGHARSWLRGFVGDVAEVALFNRALTDAERTGIETHLSAKFRIPLAGAVREEIIARADPAFRERHWAFEPISDPELPHSDKHPIDQFATAAWKQHDLHPVETADPRTLVRRLYYDLIGLPPTPEEMQSAVAALTPWNDDAWAALIDRLLASPQYGERWGRHWLDVVRYADTAGDNADYPVPEARLYRDYVIDAFNTDMSYDQFVREQIAGDLLAADGPRGRYADQVTATGFLALSRRYATAPYELWHLTLEDTIDTVGQSFLGLTLRCARCHDHKFDPVSQREYYGLYGIFESTQYPWAGAEEFQSKQTPRMHFASLLPPSEAKPLRQAHENAAKSVDDSNAELKAKFHAAHLAGYPPEIPSAYAVQEGTPRPAVLQQAGDPGRPGPVVPRSVPTFLNQLPQPVIPSDQSGRRQLAEWLTHPANPLTARVMVNRIWQHHFGRGIVATPSNFGTRGVRPTHRELLDWLARRFIDSGWSIKTMHRLILTSQVWRLSSNFDSANAALDPANEYYWRHDRRRLDAEAIRDSMLASSGRLDLTRPGQHPFPPITDWHYTQHNQFRDFYPSTHRSVYLMTTRLQRHPFLALFDSPDTNTTTDQRTTSIVPSQALYLMNSKETKTESEAFARRVLEAAPEDRIPRAFALAYQRKPTDEEAARAAEFIADYTARSNEAAAWTAYCRSLLISHETFYLD